MEAWQRVMQCPEEDPQIQKDFSSFPSIDLQQLLQEVPKRFAQRGGLIHYTILNNQVHRRSLGKYTDFKMFSDEILLSLARKVSYGGYFFGVLFHFETFWKTEVSDLYKYFIIFFIIHFYISTISLLYLSCLLQIKMPDVEFYINVGDWPMENRKVSDKPGPVPIISWCGSTDTRDIILPTYDITHSSLEAMRGVTNDLLSVQGNTGASLNINLEIDISLLFFVSLLFVGFPGPVWSDKMDKAFFRGRDSREERLNLVTMSNENPELLDAGITAFFFFREREKELGKAPLVGFFDFFKVSNVLKNFQ